MRKTLTLALTAAAFAGLATGALASTEGGHPLPPKEEAFSFEGPFGTYDRAALQRGFQVYKEVCSACHSLNRVAFHALADEGGPGFTEAQAKAIAAGYQVVAGPNDKGETTDANGTPLTRPGILADHFPPPFPNPEAARTANNGALPPDLSIIIKARNGGERYVYSLLTGYGQTPPAGFHVVEGKYYNPYFEGRNISMPHPLNENGVTFSDGTKATIPQQAHDVATFLTWAAEPKMEERKRMGFGVMLFLAAFAGVLFLSYRKLWADQH